MRRQRHIAVGGLRGIFEGTHRVDGGEVGRLGDEPSIGLEVLPNIGDVVIVPVRPQQGRQLPFDGRETVDHLGMETVYAALVEFAGARLFQRFAGQVLDRGEFAVELDAGVDAFDVATLLQAGGFLTGLQTVQGYQVERARRQRYQGDRQKIQQQDGGDLGRAQAHGGGCQRKSSDHSVGGTLATYRNPSGPCGRKMTRVASLGK